MSKQLFNNSLNLPATGVLPCIYSKQFDMKRMGIDNICDVTYMFLMALDVKVNKSSLENSLKNHPLALSMLSIVDYFSEIDLEYQTNHVDKYEFCSKNNLRPFIADFAMQQGKFALVHSILDGIVTFSNDRFKKKSVPAEIFSHTWGGNILTANPDINSGEKNLNRNKVLYIANKMVLPLLIVVIATVLICIYISKPFNSYNLMHALLEIVGVTLSILLVTHKMNSDNKLLKIICGGGTESGCNSILESNQAQITEWLSWAELGLYYFVGTLLSTAIFPHSLGSLALLAMMSFPITIYSIIYQYKTKKWCVLCCLVQFVLLSEGLIYLKEINRISSFWPSNIPLFLCCFILPVLIWNELKPLLKGFERLKDLDQENNLFKYNDDLFGQLLISQEHHIVTNRLLPVVIGNPIAENTITIISNPNCAPCKKAHQFIDAWIRTNKNIRIKILFLNDANEQKIETKVAQNIMALSLKNDVGFVEDAMRDWYENQADFNRWIARYAVKIPETVKNAIQYQKDWCKTANITYTPTVLINGYKLPMPYKISDLKYLVD